MTENDAQIADTLLSIFRRAIKGPDTTTAKAWLSGLDRQQLIAVHSVFSDFDSKPDYEQRLLSYMLNAVRTDNQPTMGLYETLVMYKAFVVPTVINKQQYKFSYPQQIILGLRDDIMTPLDLSTAEKRRCAGALAYFAFETSVSGLPYFFDAYMQNRRASTISYKDPALKQVVVQHADRMDQLVNHAITRSADAKLLGMLMSAENGTALNDGLL